MEHEQFDKKLAAECARAFSASTGLGCTLSDKRGEILEEYGAGCGGCGMCAAAGLGRDKCIRTHIYGMTEAERFGGKYIYFCPMGLTCFVSPIVGELSAEAKITVGPFVMVDKADFAACEVDGNARLTDAQRRKVLEELERVPYVAPERVNELSVLLFMAVGFLNNVSAENRMMDAARSDVIQGQIASYIMELKQETPPPYPYELERALLQSIARQDQPQAQRLLNELLGAILLAGGNDLERIKSRLYELLVLISRTAIDNGADVDRTMEQIHRHREALRSLHTIDALCFWLSDVVRRFMDELFRFSDAKHANVLHHCTQYIGAHYSEKIRLEDLARMVFLTPAYISRIFRQETGMSFNAYLNHVRIAKARELLRRRELRLTDIAQMVGYEDQSYFTKVFKSETGMLPREYREKALSAPPADPAIH